MIDPRILAKHLQGCMMQCSGLIGSPPIQRPPNTTIPADPPPGNTIITAQLLILPGYGEVVHEYIVNTLDGTCVDDGVLVDVVARLSLIYN